MTAPSRLDAALSLATLGWPVFPVGDDKRPLIKWDEGATTDDATIAKWWRKWPDALVGVHTGRAGLLVADLDVPKGDAGHDGRVELKRVGLKLPSTLSYVTRSGGQHHVYAAPEGAALTIAQGEPVPGVDVRAGVGFVVYYGPALSEAPKLAEPPAWLVEAATPKRPKATRRGDGDVDAFLARCAKGKADDEVKAARKAVTREGMSHDDMLAAVTRLVKLGAEGRPGVADAIERARGEYVADWPEHGRQWDMAVAGSVGTFGLPPVTIELSKAERKAAKAARKAAAEPGAGAAILDDLAATLSRFVVFPHDHALEAAVGWVAHAHLIDCFVSTPRLVFTSPEPGSGKTRGLEIVGELVPNPVHIASASAAYIGRRISGGDRLPTLLVDEYDTKFDARSKSEDAEQTRGILNSGHRRGAVYARAAVRGREVVTEEWQTFAAVALAGLGALPDTIRARSIVLKMRRRRRDEPVMPYRERVNGPELHALRDRLAAWSASVASAVEGAYPELPESIVDRDADVWEPLLAVADAAGGEWPQRMRAAAVAMVAEARELPLTHGIRLLADVRRVFDARGVDRIRAIDLTTDLCNLEDAVWGDLAGRGPIDGRYLGRTFRDYGIPSSHSVRLDNHSTAKGWERRDFADAFARYLPESPQPTTLPR